MSDSIDRVFVHALNTVKKIPRMGSARPPPSERLKLYGLYKQGMEGDIPFPRIANNHPEANNAEDVKSDQEKCDARELVSELEFVWDQIKDNSTSPSTPSHSQSNSQSYSNPGSQDTSDSSPTSHRGERPIYPVAREKLGHSNINKHSANAVAELNSTGNETESNALRTLVPMSQGSYDELESNNEDDVEDVEEFVDAQDSQISEPVESGNDNNVVPSANDAEAATPSRPGQRMRQFGADAGAMITAPIARYLRSQKNIPPNPQANDAATAQWQRRVEEALTKTNAELAALREQLEMSQQHDASSILRPFSQSFTKSPNHGSRIGNLLRWFLRALLRLTATIVKHLFIDALFVAVLTLWMYRRGIPVERLERAILNAIRRLRQVVVMRALERLIGRGARNLPASAVPVAVAAARAMNVKGKRPREGDG
ncbi:MAG: hypothetical protein M1831_004040 [Alyxoria varia]|nr:MAG: hypothetical protein M1831_004040 [Alyxoria varia]